jgi:APA family basic amino acid/polyamine antiporter
MLVQAVLVASGAPLQRATDTPLADAALAVAPVLGAVVLVGGLISTLGFVSGSALGTPRYLYALAQSKLLPAALHAVHPRFQSPHVAIIATATASLLFVVPFDYRSLVGMSNVAVAVQYFATCLAVLKLRTDTSGWRRAAPWLGAATSVWIVTEASFVELLWSVSSLAVGTSVVICYRLLPYKKPPAASP